MKIAQFIRSLSSEQLEKLMEIMDALSVGVSKAVIIGYNDILKAGVKLDGAAPKGIIEA